MVHIESDAESNSGLIIDEPAKGKPKQSAEMRPATQSASPDTSATALVTGAQAPREVEQEEEEMEVGGEAEASTPTLEESAKAVVSLPTPTPIPIYTTVVSSPTPTRLPIYSTLTSTTQFRSVLAPTCDAITEFLHYPLGQGPDPSSIAQHIALVQSTMSAQAPISSPIVIPTPPFNLHLEPVHMEFLKKKSE